MEGGDDDEGVAGLEGEVQQVTVGELVKVLKEMKNGNDYQITILHFLG